MRRLVTLLAVFVLFRAVNPAGAADLSDKETKAARKLYLSKCAKCHKLYDPANYADSEWQTWMGKMTKKARLKPAQAELLSRYLEVIRGPGKKSGAAP